jgi:hypothetical protein
MRLTQLLTGVLGTLLPCALGAQVSLERPAAANVFLDCQAHGCDTQHFRNEITFVNGVRERTEADVHLLITGQESGGGGAVYRLAFLGARAFAGDSTSLVAVVSTVQTDAERRDVLTNRIAQGLLHYAVRTLAADRIRVRYEEDDEHRSAGARPVFDPWNYWVFSARLNGSTNGEARDKSQELELGGTAVRTTADWKTEIELEGRYNENRFELTDRTVKSIRNNWQFGAGVVKSVARLWSLGASVEAGRSTFQNQDFYTRVATILEYSLFPYEEFSRRRITLQYSLGTRHSVYQEVTVYDRTSEQRADQQLELSTKFQQPWGSSNVSLRGSHYLHDARRYNLRAEGGLDVRLFKGFTLNLEGGYSRVRDQLYLPKGDATDDEVLLQVQQLQTNYRYNMSVGLRYTFGSVYNNIVNPRMN